VQKGERGEILLRGMTVRTSTRGGARVWKIERCCNQGLTGGKLFALGARRDLSAEKKKTDSLRGGDCWNGLWGMGKPDFRSFFRSRGRDVERDYICRKGRGGLLPGLNWPGSGAWRLVLGGGLFLPKMVGG